MATSLAALDDIYNSVSRLAVSAVTFWQACPLINFTFMIMVRWQLQFLVQKSVMKNTADTPTTNGIPLLSAEHVLRGYTLGAI